MEAREDFFITASRFLAIITLPLLIILAVFLRLERKLSVEGVVIAARQVTVRSGSGPTLVREILARPGDTVTNGQPIVRFLDTHGLREAVRIAELETRRIEEEINVFLSRTPDATERPAAKAELTALHLRLEQARLQLNQARDRAATLEVVAPFDGEIVAIHIREYDPADTGTALFDLAQRSDLFVRVFIPEKTYVLVRRGQQAYVKSHMYNYLWYRIFRGEVAYISNFAVRRSDGPPEFEVLIRITDGHRYFRINATATCEIIRDRVSLLAWLFEQQSP